MVSTLSYWTGQSAERDLHAASVVGPLGPGHDRDPQYLAGGPRPAVEDPLLQQAEEGLHGGVVACLLTLQAGGVGGHDCG